MAKNALVLKGTDFSTNKLTTVTIVDGGDIPCTALALDESSKTVTALVDFTLTATKTPADTTDSLQWSSSDTDVATVSDGVVTVVGIGTATITATCGQQTATCVVDASEFTMTVTYGFFEWQNLSSYPNLYGYKTSKRKLLAHALTGNKLLKNQTYDTTERFPILLPPGAEVVKVTYGSDMKAGTIDFGWIDSETSPYPPQYPNNASCVSLDQTHSSANNAATTSTYEKPSGADSFAVTLVTNSVDFADTDTPEGIAEAKGIVIKCGLASVSS